MRIWEHVTDTPQDGHYYFDDFENVEFSLGALEHDSLTNDNVHLADEHPDFNNGAPQYLSYVIDGRYSGKINDTATAVGSSLLRTHPSVLRFQPNTTYRVGITYYTPIDGAYKLVAKNSSGDVLAELPLTKNGEVYALGEDGKQTDPSKRKPVGTAVSFEFSTGDDENCYISLVKTGETKDRSTGYLIIDNFVVDDMTPGDKTELAALVAEMEMLDLSGYTAESRAAFEKALATAKAVLAQEDAISADLYAAQKALENARDGLVLTSDGTTTAPTSTVTVNNAANGTVTVNKTTATMGSTVIITATPAEGYGVAEPEGGNYNPIVLTNGTLTIQERPYSGPVSGNTTTTEVVTNPDGSVTTTVTNHVTGATTATTVYKDGSKAVVSATDDQITKIEVIISAESMTAAEESDKAISVSMPAIALFKSSEDAAPITINFGGTSPVKVELPVENVTPGTVAALIMDDGSEKMIKTCVVTEDGITFTVEDGATVKVFDNTKQFTDVVDGAWYVDYVDFVSSRDLFNGTSESHFTPDAFVTRATLMTVLARMDDQDTEGGTVWYEKGMEWAVENGISDGSNPDGLINREQLVVMLYRYAGEPETAGSLETFADADAVSLYAEKALQWSVENGVIHGKGAQVLDPQGGTTRAEVAAMLMRYCAIMGQ